ncbi:probable phospholipase A1 magnifin [Diorhabda sublineata]|uniref:probable phospholipase A1 magnifin n=1 Tax=Diorhabda sublineata TaxID=1163346 RepID=UPI0024E04AFE|nr:probable phospholipase A1 magnifin [Diorhabda sublineata]
MSWLSQIVGVAVNLLFVPFSDNGTPNQLARSDNSYFPFDILRTMEQPCRTYTFEMGENEMKLTALARGFCSNCCPAKIQRDIRFVAYSKSNPNGVPINNLRPGDALKAGVNSSIPTVIFIHGFSEASPGHSGQTILDAYLTRPEPRNIILLDWSELATFPWYQVAVTNSKLATIRLKKFIEVFHKSGEIPIWNLHVIGFSLGGHIAGVAGKILRDGLKIPRITGLDPALPEFSLKDPSKRLSKESAEYVDVIHTDAGVFGFPLALGHADFFPNGGRALQPGCQPSYLVKQRIVDQVVACSHIRAWKLYAESVIDEKAFPATSCPLWRGPNKQCEFKPEAYMGFANNNSTFGSYYLITHESKPYGRRMAK